MWRTADPPTRVQIPPRPLNKSHGEKIKCHQINNDISPLFSTIHEATMTSIIVSVNNELMMNILLNPTLPHPLLSLDYFLFDWNLDPQKITISDFSLDRL